MAEAARRVGNGLGADVARRLIARPIHRQIVQAPRASQRERPAGIAPDPEPADTIVTPDLTHRLEAEILVMKAVLAAERRENASLRACIGFEDDDLGDEARATRDRWAGMFDRLLQATR